MKSLPCTMPRSGLKVSWWVGGGGCGAMSFSFQTKLDVGVGVMTIEINTHFAKYMPIIVFDEKLEMKLVKHKEMHNYHFPCKHSTYCY